jgi:hypothetical protein
VTPNGKSPFSDSSPSESGVGDVGEQTEPSGRIVSGVTTFDSPETPEVESALQYEDRILGSLGLLGAKSQGPLQLNSDAPA